jgi:single-stranded DNA-specific DHH superfamily exonuclease
MIKEIPLKFKEFVLKINEKDNVGIIFDGDPDGLCSGAIIFKAIQKITGKKPVLIFTQGKDNPWMNKKTAEKLKENKVNKVICVDSSIDQKLEGIKEIEKVVEKFLIIDHHKKYNEVDSNKTIMFKAGNLSNLDGAQYPCSKFSFDLFSFLSDLNEIKWIAGVGILGDNGLKTWNEFTKTAAKEINSNLNELNKLKELITSVEVMNWNELNELVFEFIKAKNPKEVLESKFNIYLTEFEKEVQRILNEFNEKKEEINDLVFFEINSNKRLKGEIANRLSNLEPNKTFFIFQKFNEQILISARRQDNMIKMNDLIEESIKGLNNASGGGHIPAAAGKIQLKDLNEFKEKIKEKINQ